jgi:eukaryotic-like serine/threonine-protein kinase
MLLTRSRARASYASLALDRPPYSRVVGLPDNATQPRGAQVGATSSIVGRYTLHEMIGAGGMASVYLGRLRAGSGFARTVAIKRLHPQFALDAEFVEMFITEARLAARIRHPNVVATLDVVHDDGDVLLVMDYVQGESLFALIRHAAESRTIIPIDIAAGILGGVLAGLQAAHTATHDDGKALQIVHRDVSPENILVGIDGTARVLDFGVAKAVGMSNVTKEGTIKGKLAYMAPEQARGAPVTPSADLFSTSVVLWEALTGRRLFKGDNDAETLNRILRETIPSPTCYRTDIPAALDLVIMKGLERDPEARFASAESMHSALEAAVTPATSRRTAAWLSEIAKVSLEKKARKLAVIESSAPMRVERALPLLVDDTELDTSLLRIPIGGLLAARDPSQIAIVVGAIALLVALLAWAWPNPRAHSQPALSAPSAQLQVREMPGSVALPPQVPPAIPTSATIRSTGQSAASSSAHSATRASANPPPRRPAASPAGSSLYSRD